MPNNEQIIRDFVAAWSRLNTDEIVSYFAADGIYHNMPVGPVQGTKALKQFIGGFIADWTATEWDILNILSEGNIVMVERLDRTQVGEKPVNLPCFGIFEMEDGKIKVWRDYFDMGTYVGALS